MPLELSADCERCVALCCVASTFSRSGDFALDKPAGQACPNLAPDDRCGIHAQLRERGFPGCVAFDCFGAGQRVTQGLFDGQSWRGAPERAARMFRAFHALRPLHGMLWHAREASALELPAALSQALAALRAELEAAAALSLDEVEAIELSEIGGRAHRLLTRASRAARGRGGRALDGADLIGAGLRGQDLRRAGLCGALLLGADLRGADLRGADLRGADLRVARLHGADLRGALFLTPMQLAAALGDASTRLPEGRSAPAHWGGAA